MMNSGDTDPTFIETNIPWVFRCISDDRRQCYLLSDYFYRKLNLNRVGVIRASNRYGRFGIREIRDSSRRLGKPIPVEMAYSLGTEDFSLQLERLSRRRFRRSCTGRCGRQCDDSEPNAGRRHDAAFLRQRPHLAP